MARIPHCLTLALFALCARPGWASGSRPEPVPRPGSRPDSDWKLVREKDGIRILTRPAPGEEIHHLRAETRIRATVDRLMEVYMDGEGHVRWYPACVQSRLVRRTAEGSPVIYHRIANPWPVQDRDYAFVIDTASAEEPGGKVARYRDVPGLVPESDGCVRMRRLAGYWKFVPAPDGFTAVTYVFAFDPGPGTPASFINLSLPRIGGNMLKGLAKGARDE